MGIKVHVRVHRSHIHGLGIFTLHPIQAGAVIWGFEPGIDLFLTEKPTGRLADWAWREADGWVLPTDYARYMNHSSSPNVLGGANRHQPDVAARDIAAGEELTIDYSTFDLDYPSYAKTYG